MLLQPTASRPRQAVWSLGFRPFFLGGSLFALIALLLWAGVLAGALAPAPPGVCSPGTATRCFTASPPPLSRVFC